MPIKSIIFTLALFMCLSCSSILPIKNNVEFSDINGVWESTGYLHYLKMNFINHQEGTLLMINDNFKTKEYLLINFLFENEKISFDGLKKNGTTKERLHFEGTIFKNRLILVEKNSKKDVISLIRKEELTKIRMIHNK